MSAPMQSSRTINLTSVFKELLCFPQCRVQEQYLWIQYLQSYYVCPNAEFKNNISEFSIYRAIMFAPMQSARTITLISVFTELLCLPQCRVQEQWLWFQYLQSYYVSPNAEFKNNISDFSILRAIMSPNAEFKNNDSDFSIYRAIMSPPMQSSRTITLISVFTL